MCLLESHLVRGRKYPKQHQSMLLTEVRSTAYVGVADILKFRQMRLYGNHQHEQKTNLGPGVFVPFLSLPTCNCVPFPCYPEFAFRRQCIDNSGRWIPLLVHYHTYHPC